MTATLLELPPLPDSDIDGYMGAAAYTPEAMQAYGQACAEAALSRAESAEAVLARVWIPVSERLPEYAMGEVRAHLVCNRGGQIAITHSRPEWWNHKDARGREFDGPEATHWQPLPAPPDLSGALQGCERGVENG